MGAKVAKFAAIRRDNPRFMSHEDDLLSRVQTLRIEDYTYPLEFEQIAQSPRSPRESARLLVYDGQQMSDRLFYDLTTLLPRGSWLTGNNTRVMHARLRAHTASGAGIELFLLEPSSPVDYEASLAQRTQCEWKCLVGNSKRWKGGLVQGNVGDSGTFTAERISHGAESSSYIRFQWEGGASFAEILDKAGSIPIPPYLKREATPQDDEWYQTVYSSIGGSVAAPTAGLHFSESLLTALAEQGIPTSYLTLHVGAGTFLPVKSDTIGGHPMHHEVFSVDRTLLESLAASPTGPIAIGTTTLRTLESLYWLGVIAQDLNDDQPLPSLEQWAPYQQPCTLSRAESLGALLRYLDIRGLDRLQASTSLLIAPGYRLRVARGLITNFHQPQSTLLLLVAALVGDAWRTLYQHALDSGYQFLSYGDAMLILPDAVSSHAS